MYGFKQTRLGAAIFATAAIATFSDSMEVNAQNAPSHFSAHGFTATASATPNRNRVTAQVTVHNDSKEGQYISYCALVQSGSASLTDGRKLTIDTSSIGGIGSQYGSQMSDCIHKTEPGEMTFVEPSGTVIVSISWYDGNGSGREVSPDLSINFPFNFAVRSGSSTRIESATIRFQSIQLAGRR